MDNLDVKSTVENPEEQQPTGTETVTPQEEKLYAGRFKTPEELETGYKQSSQEGVRLSQEVKRLTGLLQQAQTPKEAQVIKDKIDDLAQYFDPETAKILKTYVDGAVQRGIKDGLNSFQEQTRQQGEFQTQVSEIWEETKKLYPDVANPQSKLYLRANEILFERKLAEIGADGTVKLLTPFAYRIAVEAASEELGRQAPQTAETQERKGRATAVQGRASKTVPQGKLTYEQYQALSDEQKDVYDQAQTK